MLYWKDVRGGEFIHKNVCTHFMALEEKVKTSMMCLDNTDEKTAVIFRTFDFVFIEEDVK